MTFKDTSSMAKSRYGPGTVIVMSLCACMCAAQSSSPTSHKPAPPTAHLKLGSRALRPPATQMSPDAKNQAAPLPSDQAATPPQVDLNNGKLKVDAHNSDLSTILQDVAAQSGMTVDGLSRNTRVFGIYGPGSPHDVISDLLAGAGYNFVMVGGQNGSVPRELVLTAENGSAPVNATGPGLPSRPGSENPDQDENESEPVRSGPIAHPNQNDDDPDDPTHNPKRMEQHLENLRHMQDIIQQSQQNQQGEPEQESQPQ